MSLPALLRALAAIVLLSASAATAGAADLPMPAGRVILEIAGKVANTNQPGVAAFDLAALEALPSRDVKTTTPWTEGETTFTGVRLRDLLEKVGASGTEISAIALNDYKVTIPVEDAQKHDVIIAYQRDGKAMPVREKGPLWVMYPFSENPVLKNDLYYARCIWQLKRMEVR